MKTVAELKREIQASRSPLLDHPIYREVNSIDRLRQFMEIHVFAVWDFMSLAKRLQRDLTCVRLPWVPAPCPETARFINEVVLGEECDLGPDGRPKSHLELYLEAMGELGANTEPFETFLSEVSSGRSWQDALDETGLPGRAKAFVAGTLRCAVEGSTAEVASAFLFGREDLIPEMFERLLSLWPSPEEVPGFQYYLRRHIELDGDHHGPLAEKMLQSLLDEAPERWDEAVAAARRALDSRCALWDAICEGDRNKKACLVNNNG